MNPNPDKSVRTRIAPSPTGPVHVGLARVALYNWLFTRQKEGKFFLRIEDTDKERSKKEYEKEIIDGLTWLGLSWDGEIVHQSEKAAIHKKYLEKLLSEKRAYYCYCTKEELEAQRQSMESQGLSPKYLGHCRELKNPPDREPALIRFRSSESKVGFSDLIRGKVSFDASLIGDFSIAKDLETPLYNFAATIDDAEMKITHVIRGEDHISNTPKQIMIQEALGLDRPIYAHLPLILAPDRSKLSKRRDNTSLMEYKKQGYLPEAMINFLALLGWHPAGDEEIFSLDDLIRIFNISRVQKSGAIFNKTKLDWINGQYINNLTVSDIFDRLSPMIKEKGIKANDNFVKQIVEIEKERIKKLEDFFELSDFFFNLPEYNATLLKWREASLPEIKIILAELLDIINKIPEKNFDEDGIKSAVDELINKNGRGSVLWPFRVALSGKSASPDPLVISKILGKNETIRRIEISLTKLGNI